MQTTHDPPGPPPCTLPRDRPLTDNEVLMARRPRRDRQHEQQRAREHAQQVGSSDSYELLSAYVGEDLMTLVRDMVQGRYRWRRTRGGFLAVEDGEPVPDLMSFRVIDDELHRRYGKTVSYETLRRWWGVLYPDEPSSAASRPAPRRPRGYRAPSAPTPDAEAGGPPEPPEVPPVEFLPPSTA